MTPVEIVEPLALAVNEAFVPSTSASNAVS